MHIEYDTTIDEIVDVNVAVVSASKAAKRMRWQATMWAALFSGVILYLFLAHLGAPISERLIFTGLGVIISAGGYNLTYHQSLKRRMRKCICEKIKSESPIRFMVELRDDCIWTKQSGVQLSVDWGNVSEIKDSGDAVVFRMSDGGFVFVRNKGFASDQDKKQFMKIAHERQAKVNLVRQ